MIPIKDENPTFSTPVVTIALIVVNIIVFFTEPITSSADAQLKYFACHAAIPYEVTHGERVGTLVRRAAGPDRRLEQNEVPFRSIEELKTALFEIESCPQKNVWLSILKSMFLHGSILHIAGNMLFLWVFGNNVEDRLGKIRYIAFYLLAGLAATYTQSYLFSDSGVPLIGASGAIAGILGAYLLMFPRARVKSLIILIIFITAIDIPAYVMIGIWFLQQLLSSVGSVSGDTGVAYMAHVGGFLAGMLLLLIFRPRRPQRTAVPY